MLVVSSKVMKDIMRIVMSLEEPGLLMKDVTQTVDNETKD